MTKLQKLFISTLAATTLSAAAYAAPGYKSLSLDVEHRSVPLNLHVWYPSEKTTKTIELGKNAVFTGVEVRPGAAALKGRHPLVVLSHGSGGNAVNIAWIAAELADRGMVVVAPNHPGTTSNDSLQSETVKIWERPADMSAIIDHGLAKGFSGVQIDGARIGAVGFSLGGNTVLGLAGAKASKQKYIDYCDQFAGMHDCGWLAKGGVDLTKTDQQRFEQSNVDARIKTVVAIDPALSQAYQTESLKQVSVPVKLINLGEGDAVPSAVNARDIVGHFSDASLTNVKEGTHFSFLGQCTRLGPMIIMAALEDPICSETGTRKRSDIHEELKGLIGDYLARQLTVSTDG